MADCSLTTGDSNLDLEKQSYRRKLHSFYEVKEEIGRYPANLPQEPRPPSLPSCTLASQSPQPRRTQSPRGTLETPPPGSPCFL